MSGAGAMPAAVVDMPSEAGHAEDRTATSSLGLWLFIASETMLFLALAAARFYLAGFESEELDLRLGVLLTVDLLLSSGLGYVAARAIARGDRRRCLGALGGAIALGGLFCVGVMVEWSSASFPPASPFGTAFFTLTGLHLSHLLTGMVGLVAVANLVRTGRFGPGDHWGVTGTVRYWTFVDVMWLVIVFPVLYLV